MKRSVKARTKDAAKSTGQEIQKESKPKPRASREPITCNSCGKTQRKDKTGDKGESGMCSTCQRNKAKGIEGRNRHGQAVYLCFECGKE